MAIIHSTAIGKAKGSLGNITYRTQGGVCIGSERVPKGSGKSRTLAQMRLRTQWANLINLYQAFTGHDRPSFEARTARVSDYNLFISRNNGAAPVYLTRSEAGQGACVVAPYLVTEGSLPAIDVSASGVSGEVGTDISLGNLNIGEETTLGQFSAAIITNNEEFIDGDQITAFVIRQETNAQTNVPYVRVQAYKVVLNSSDSTTLLSDIDPDGLVFAKQGSSDKLGMSQTVNGGVVYIHSRKVAGETKVSTQRLVVANTILSRYQTPTAMISAITSYGGQTTSLYLTPTDPLAPSVNP